MKKKEESTGQPAKDKDAESAKSPEFLAFEDLAKKVLGVPKSELDKRESDLKATHPKSHGLRQ